MVDEVPCQDNWGIGQDAFARLPKVAVIRRKHEWQVQQIY